MLRLGIISPEFPPDIGGVETYAHQYVRALRRIRPEWEISVFTLPHAAGEIRMPGVQIIPTLRRRLSMDRRLLAVHRIDVWHVMNAAYGWVAAEADRVLVTVHGNDFLRPYYLLLRPDLERFLPLRRSPAWLDRWQCERSQRRLRQLLQVALPRARCILTNSRYTEQVFLQHFPACRGITTPAMVGVGEEFLAAKRHKRARAEAPRLVTVSRLSESRKNIDLVLQALARLGEDFVFLYRVVGDGPDRQRLEALASDLGIAERVEFTGALSQERMIEILAASDLFILVSSVLPYSHEGFGIAYLEANACGTPVLAARLGGAAEAVAEGQSGIFVAEATVEQIADALRSFLSGAIQFAPDSCRRHARRFVWDNVVGAALPCYEDTP